MCTETNNELYTQSEQARWAVERSACWKEDGRVHDVAWGGVKGASRDVVETNN